MADLLTDNLPISLTDQIECVEREIRMRVEVYDRRVADKRMTRAKADLEIARMRAVLATLKRHGALRSALEAVRDWRLPEYSAETVLLKRFVTEALSE